MHPGLSSKKKWQISTVLTKEELRERVRVRALDSCLVECGGSGAVVEVGAAPVTVSSWSGYLPHGSMSAYDDASSVWACTFQNAKLAMDSAARSATVKGSLMKYTDPKVRRACPCYTAL